MVTDNVKDTFFSVRNIGLFTEAEKYNEQLLNIQFLCNSTSLFVLCFLIIRKQALRATMPLNYLETKGKVRKNNFLYLLCEFILSI